MMTTTGVAGSPTKNTRQMQTSMRVADGEDWAGKLV